MKRDPRKLFSRPSGRRSRALARVAAARPRRLDYERLEERNLFSAAPFGAFPDDTAEYMLGDVLVSVVLMESNNNVSVINPNTETWTPNLIAATKQNVQTGVEWWEQTLATQFPGSPHLLDFHFDFTYADNPVPTNYEPISQKSDFFQYWMYDFLNPLGYNTGESFSSDIRAFNNAQRLAHGTDWAFTIFVVNDTVDGDDKFALGSKFAQAFSYAGGQFMVSPASRPASTFAHETGHMFWAKDEYRHSDGTKPASYLDRRGYYNTQNWNYVDNPTPGFSQVTSIMRESPLDAAYDGYTSSTSSLEMIGWRDSDGDGVFDVLDVPHTLTGTGYLDPASGQYRFVGASSVQTLPNLNSAGLQNDITLNEITRAEYRVDGGDWQTAAIYNSPVAKLDLSFPVPASGVHIVEIRTVDAVSGVTSPIFHGDTARPASVLQSGISGFVWHDLDGDSALDNSEARLAGWTVRLVDGAGVPLNLVQELDPDAYPTGTVLNSTLPQASLSLNGDPKGRVLVWEYGSQKVFGPWGSGLSPSSTWKPGDLGLRIDFTAPVASVRLDALGTGSNDRARLDAYDRFGVLIGRYTTASLADGQLETMQLRRPVADIAYVIAEAHSGIAVGLDRLRFGPETQAKTDAQGAYAIPSLPAGSYTLEAISPSGRVLTDSRRQVVLAEGEPASPVDLIAHQGDVSWQNTVRPVDVNGDGDLTALDALIVINYINAHGSDLSLPTDDVPPPYYDVDGNGQVTAGDVLLVINQLNTAASLVGGNGGSSGGESPALAEGESAAVAALPHLSPLLPAAHAATHDPAAIGTPARPPGPAVDRPPMRFESLPGALHGTLLSAPRRTPFPAVTELPGFPDLEDVVSLLADDVLKVFGTTPWQQRLQVRP